MQKLLTIEQVVAVNGIGFVVLPEPPFWEGPIEVDAQAELRRADGRRLGVHLCIAIEHRSLTLEAARAGMPSLARPCVLRSLDAELPQVGDELWCRDDLVQLVRRVADGLSGHEANDPRSQ